MAERHELKRSLWGLDPAEAEALLAEQGEPLLRERVVLQRAVEMAEAEADRLAAEIRQMSERIPFAEKRLALIRQGLERQRSLSPAHGLALHRQLSALEREHSLLIEEGRRREEAIRAEIEERQRSLHQWVMELLRSVAGRSSKS
ncbi:MAG: hypothetical protein ACOY93_21515 [Bacillota bacterium]